MLRCCEAACLCLSNFWLQISYHNFGQLYLLLECSLNVLLEQPQVTLLAFNVHESKCQDYNFSIVIDCAEECLKQSILILSFPTASDK